jgi:hypothetical protein
VQSSKRYGVIIGVSDYTEVGPGNNLRYTTADAQRVYKCLLSRADFAVENVRLLCDSANPELKKSAKPPSRSNILECVNDVAKRATEEDMVLVYFAGHGSEIGGNPYLLTNDTRMDVVKETAIDVSVLNGYLEASMAKCVVRLFDACRTPVVSDARAFAQRMSRGLQSAILKAGKGWGTFNSCSSGEYSFEPLDLEHGVFTYFVCEGLEGKAADQTGVVSWDRLVDYVKTSIAAYCKEQSWVQTPHAISDFAGSLELARGESAKDLKEGQDRHDAPAAFLQMVGRHTASLPEHIRDLTATKNGEMVLMHNNILEHAKRWAAALKKPELDVSVETKPALQSFDAQLWSLLNKNVDNVGLRKEFTSETSTIELKLTPAQIVIPSSRLVIVAVRFHFLYWLWFLHQSVRTEAHTDWQPDPPMTTGYFTFKPSGVRKLEKIQETLDLVLSRVTEDIDGWSQQSRRHFEARTEALKRSSIIS